jgi:hypothetical protein
VNGPEPPRPSDVDSDTKAGNNTAEKSEHGQAAVENDQLYVEVIAVPSIAFTPVVMVTAYEVEPTSWEFGESVITFVESLYETVDGTAVPVVVASITVDGFTVAGSSEREIVAVIVGLRETRLSPFAGEVELTAGGGSASAATAKVHEYGVPSVAPSVAATVPLRRAVYVAPAANGADGVNVAVRLALS